MKTLHPQSTVKISQSEAMLKAIESGFFEAFLEKSKVVELISKNTSPGIRIELNESKRGNLTFCIRTIGKVGKETKLVSRSQAAISAWPYSVEFESNDLHSLLAQPECVGIRFFPGRCQQAKPTLVAVGVKSNGFDIDQGTGYLLSLKTTTSNIA